MFSIEICCHKLTDMNKINKYIMCASNQFNILLQTKFIFRQFLMTGLDTKNDFFSNFVS